VEIQPEGLEPTKENFLIKEHHGSNFPRKT
jgi:hypothetical protein